MELTNHSLRKQIGFFIAKKIETGKLASLVRKDPDALDRTLMMFLNAERDSKVTKQLNKNESTKQSIDTIVGILTSRIKYYNPRRIAKLFQVLSELNYSSIHCWGSILFPYFAANYTNYTLRINNDLIFKLKTMSRFYPGSEIYSAFQEHLLTEKHDYGLQPWENPETDTAGDAKYLMHFLDDSKDNPAENLHEFVKFLQNLA